MADGFVHTVHADGWRNTIEGGEPLDGRYDTKAEAIEAGRSEARRRANRARDPQRGRVDRRAELIRQRPRRQARLSLAGTRDQAYGSPGGNSFPSSPHCGSRTIRLRP